MYKPDTFALPEPAGDGTKDIFSGELKTRIIELGQSGYPLVFNALDYMNRPFGFACYYLKNNDISNYMNTMLATNALSMGIGGYVIVRYQTLLLDKMDKMYRHDALTGLYNRVGFQKLFKHKISNTDLIGEKITVIMADLDGLKYINYTFGHAEGDNAIAVVAKALSLSTPESALSVRFGGDELFSVIFGECNPDEITSSITEYLDKYNKYSGKPYKVSSSCGCKTDIFDKDYNMTQALKEADDKMYVIKKNRRGMN
jgi:diguanylate cyclase (GGDEF)-like protein